MPEDDQDNRPLFLNPDGEGDPIPSTSRKHPKSPEVTWGDHMLRTNRPLTPRHRLLAKMSAEGATNKEIAAKLKLSPETVSHYLTNSRIRREKEKHMERFFESTVPDRIKAMSPDALDTIEQHINDPALSTKEKLDACKWVIEKHSGKAAQQVNVTADINLNHIHEELKRMRESGQVIDVTPTKVEGQTPIEGAEPEPVDELKDWVNKNL